MKVIATLSALLIFVGIIRAQEPALPQPEMPDATPTTSAGVSPSPAPELIPLDILSPAERAASPPPTAPNAPPLLPSDEPAKPNPLTAIAATARLHAEWRQLRNRVRNDSALKAALATADAARTDLERRKLLRRYYEIYYEKLSALAATPEIRAYLIARRDEQLVALAQPRVRPTPTPSPAKPSPSPAP